MYKMVKQTSVLIILPHHRDLYQRDYCSNYYYHGVNRHGSRWQLWENIFKNNQVSRIEQTNFDIVCRKVTLSGAKVELYWGGGGIFKCLCSSLISLMK